MSCLKHFIITSFRATGRESMRDLMADCFGTGMMVADLRHVGRQACSREMLKS